MNKDKISLPSAVISLSGGLDSSTLLYEYADQIALAVSFDYGSKHNRRELECARHLCQKLGIEHLIIPLKFIGQYYSSNLLEGQGHIPMGDYDEENMAATVVPFRNGIMLSVLAGLAESRGLDTILIANHFGDHHIYPDCRSSFIEPMTLAIKEGTSNCVSLHAPYTNLTKADIVRRGLEFEVPYADTYSCYCGTELHCGDCATCRERKQAFEEIGVVDPTIYTDNKPL